MLTALGKKLRVLRIHNGELLKDMAEKLGVTSAYLSSIENGKRMPTRKLVNQVIEIYALSDELIDDLLNAYFETIDEVNINISSTNASKKELGLVFARKFDGLSEYQVESLIKILSSQEDQ